MYHLTLHHLLGVCRDVSKEYYISYTVLAGSVESVCMHATPTYSPEQHVERV